jgi:hypothetical protein
MACCSLSATGCKDLNQQSFAPLVEDVYCRSTLWENALSAPRNGMRTYSSRPETRIRRKIPATGAETGGETYFALTESLPKDVFTQPGPVMEVGGAGRQPLSWREGYNESIALAPTRGPPNSAHDGPSPLLTTCIRTVCNDTYRARGNRKGVCLSFAEDTGLCAYLRPRWQ